MGIRTACLWRSCALFLILQCTAFIVLAAYGQSRTDSESAPRYTYVFSGVTVSDALNTLIDQTEISLIFESNLVEGLSTYCRADRLELAALLTCILKDTGLDYVRLSSGTYVIVHSALGGPLYGHITGAIRDIETGQPIENANILLLTEDVGTASSRAGRFVFSPVIAGPHVLTISHVSYEHFVDTVFVSAAENVILAVELRKRTLLSDPIVISDYAATQSNLRTSSNLVSELELLDVNPLATVNVLQTIDLIDGVTLGESLSSIHIQGSASGEHTYRLDGTTVYVPVRLGGFFGPFSPFAVSQIEVQKAGFGVAHGSQLAGVVDITQQVAPATARRAEFQLDPLSVNARVSGRTNLASTVNAAWMIAFRRDLQYPPYFNRVDNIFRAWSEPDFYLVDELRRANGLEALPSNLKKQIEGKRIDFNVGFTDIHAASKVNLGAFHSLQLSLYQNRNIFGENIGSLEDELKDSLNSEDRYKWENTTAQFTYEGILSGRLFLDATLSLSMYNLLDTFGGFPLGNVADSTCVVVCAGPGLADDFNEIEERKLTVGVRYAANLRHSFLARVEFIRSSGDFTLTLNPFQSPILSDVWRNPIQWRLAGFIEDSWSIGRSLTVESGIRLSYLPDHETVYVEPRIGFRLASHAGENGRIDMYAAVGLFRQFVHQVDVSTYSLNALFPSIRFWLPLDKFERPPKAYHVTSGLVFEPSRDWTMSVDSYYKFQPHLLVLNYGSDVRGFSESIDADPPPLLTNASGRAFGLSTAIERHTSYMNVRLRYDYVRAERKVENRFDGTSFIAPWSAPHSLLATIEVSPVDNLAITIRGHAIFGRSWGFRRSYYDYLEPLAVADIDSAYDLSDPEAHRLPAFFQVDAGITHTIKVGAMDMQTRVHVLNVLGRKNVRDWHLVESESTGHIRRISRFGLPFLPMFSIRLGV